ncbi:YcgL domain-containing protein [Tahibacter amnicola]|uniref:YcgL domain-containing protein N4264_02435 n=1 Tax=Tahibacter amnicola TaxID=2976241 RepID=A0ABY6BL54_9GAMM|nr:YcgL domain-containing protein [Tahibacter amnicola]UXI68532.1 YcgL domain-containing protein [Tahibacter amnicola]
MQCFVYRSERKADTYVYLRERDAFGLLPASLAQGLGQLTFVIELTLSPDRKLAREDVEAVMANLRGPGFHLQLPPVQGLAEAEAPSKPH